MEPGTALPVLLVIETGFGTVDSTQHPGDRPYPTPRGVQLAPRYQRAHQLIVGVILVVIVILVVGKCAAAP
jgi:hypothetical protein